MLDDIGRSGERETCRGGVTVMGRRGRAGGLWDKDGGEVEVE